MTLPSNPTLSALWEENPKAAAAQVQAALDTHATKRAAARALGVSWRTLYRWIKSRPELLDERQGLGRGPNPRARANA